MASHPFIDFRSQDGRAWPGDFLFLIQSLILKDIRIRYRNMSLGMLWSLLNPLVMTTVLWFIFTKVMPSKIPNFAAFALCGIVPYNIFATSWLIGTTAVVENSALIKRVAVPREIIPIASILGNCVQMSAQIALLLGLVLASGLGINRYWLWFLVVWPLEIAFVVGLSLISSALNVYVRDIRYLVESANVVLFWLVPIFYDFPRVPPQYHEIYKLNPVAALVLASRTILLDGEPPRAELLIKLALSSLLMLVIGFFVFRKLQVKFYNYL